MRQQLWWIALGPSIWAVHFLACYLTAAIWCEKFASAGSANSPLWWLIGVYSVIALVGLIVVSVMSFRSFRRGDPPVSYDFDDPHERTPFLGFTAYLLSLLSIVATLFTVLVFLLVRSCD
ncbi:transmembrane prediction [Aporhodopirellula aestuarii]